MGPSHDDLGDGAREQALRGLVDRGVISAEQAVAVREALAGAKSERPRVRWSEIAGYIGGGLVLAGAFALVATSWEELTQSARIAVLAVLSVALVAGGTVMAGGPRAMTGRSHRVPTVRRRITGVLLALASVTTALAVNEFTEDGSFLVGSAVGLAVAAAGYVALPSAVGLVACWGMSAAVVGSAIDEAWPDAADGLTMGVSYLVLGLLWGLASGFGVLTHRRLGLGLGAGTALAGAQLPLSWDGESVWGYSLTLAVAVLLLGYYHWDRTGVLLVFGVLGITIAVPEMVWDITDGAIGAAAVLLLAGAVLLVASWIGIRLHRGRHPEG
ncbi:DUF2157 domain-containing protein [Allosalinactinospora lopnorensis]|uniref:DUF2157 domain-containing protein n=1 Tax=Allosalinactinospora lopnorensis TaxID=1352348 RepID=UPI000623BAB8|nr:DUF2157 domain-containing protein [Allosalinactinospora lopnorensis]